MIPSDMENPRNIPKLPEEFCRLPVYSKFQPRHVTNVKQKWIIDSSGGRPLSGIAEWTVFTCYFHFVETSRASQLRVYLLFIMSAEQMEKEKMYYVADIKARIAGGFSERGRYRFFEGQVTGWFDGSDWG